MMGKLKVRSLKRHLDSYGTVILLIQIQQCFNMSAKMAEARGSDRKQEDAMISCKNSRQLGFYSAKTHTREQSINLHEITLLYGSESLFQQQCKLIHKTWIIMYTWLW